MWHHSLIFVDKHVVTTCPMGSEKHSCPQPLPPSQIVDTVDKQTCSCGYYISLYGCITSCGTHMQALVYTLIALPPGSLVSIIQVCKWWKVSVIATHTACPACIRVRREHFLHIMI